MIRGGPIREKSGMNMDPNPAPTPIPTGLHDERRANQGEERDEHGARRDGKVDLVRDRVRARVRVRVRVRAIGLGFWVRVRGSSR